MPWLPPWPAVTRNAAANTSANSRRSFRSPPTPAALGSYEELLASPNVDAVYIPLPTGLRKEWVLRAAAAGKHVVCEKPCGVTAADVQEMTDACRQTPRAIHGRRHVHAQSALGAGSRNARRRQKRRSDAADCVGVQFPRYRRIFRQQHPRGRAARADRLPWRSGLVLHPVYALGAEMATAAHRHGPDSVAIRIQRTAGYRRPPTFPPNWFLTAAFRRRFTVRFSPPCNNGFLSVAGMAGCGCPISSIRSTAMNRPLKSTGRRFAFRPVRQRRRRVPTWPTLATRPRRTRSCSAISPIRFFPAH